jgi:uncharacterized protein (UPF0332 family)
MREGSRNKRHQIRTYLNHAYQSLDSAASSFNNDFYATAINRAYYAIFYAASGLLLLNDISRSKHSGVIAAFRRNFVKSGLIEIEYSDIYGDVMDARVVSDYDVTIEADPTTAKGTLEDARRFVERVSRHLREEGWLEWTDTLT